MLNIVVPMAGRGQRFAAVGYGLPKPLIPIHGVPMIAVAIECLRPSRPHRFIFVVLREHLQNGGVEAVLRRAAPDCEIVITEGVTEGALCTVLLAKRFIDNDSALMIANCDQYVDIDIDRYLAEQDATEADGLIMTFHASHPKWSYVRFDAYGRVCAVLEKQVVSNEATVGVYNYRRGRDLIAAGEAMIAKNLRVNNEFYVAPAYNEMIASGAKLTTYSIDAERMHGIGEPADLERFIGLKVSRRAADKARR